jgi:rhodanese-related sulfurtransferase
MTGFNMGSSPGIVLSMAFLLLTFQTHTMRTTMLLFTIVITGTGFIRHAGEPGNAFKPSIVDFDAFEKLTTEVNQYRKDRLVTLEQFLAMSKETNTIILDTRSKEMYDAKHVKGALHLNFADFTQRNLWSKIGSPEKRILIYCNNNFSNDPVYFATKDVQPVVYSMGNHKPLSLALNVPTFINLYGYGYKNVYELSQLVDVAHPDIEWEGTAVNTDTSAPRGGGYRNPGTLPQSIVDFDAFEKLTAEVNMHRTDRLVTLKEFQRMSKEENTIILDTRSKEFYDRKHVKGAIHLNFSDFTQDNLARLIASPNTRILIYCNNNFSGDEVNFASKVARPMNYSMGYHKPLSLALNVPTFINLYGYGYKNVYELSQLVDVNDPGMEFDGTDVKKVTQNMPKKLKNN